MPATQD